MSKKVWEGEEFSGWKLVRSLLIFYAVVAVIIYLFYWVVAYVG